jgi:hypothetical protein
VTDPRLAEADPPDEAGGHPSPDRGAEHPALAAYRARTRRSMTIYGAVILVIGLVAFLAVRLAYAHGELDKVSLQTAPAPTSLPTGSIAGTLSSQWQTSDRAAGGTPYSEGIVVTYSGHTVNGRDARTGAVRWHYTRADELVCGLVQQDRSTIAIYQRGKNCDEVTGFVTATGQPKFYRTLMDNGSLALASAPNVVLAVSDSAVHVFDNAGGLDRWRWIAPPACTVDRSLAGSKGVLTAYHCGAEYHLSLHELTGAKETWSILVDQPYLPISAGTVIAAASTSTGRTITLSAGKGAITAGPQLGSAAALTSSLRSLPRSQTTVEGSDSSNRSVELVRLGSLYCLNATGKLLWSGPTESQPTLVGTDFVTGSVGGRVVLYRLNNGQPAQQISIGDSGVPPGTTAYEAGTGLLLAGSKTEFYS